MDFLPSSFGFDPLGWTADRTFASQVLWFDALVHNVDRPWRNPNLLIWHNSLTSAGGLNFFRENSGLWESLVHHGAQNSPRNPFSPRSFEAERTTARLCIIALTGTITPHGATPAGIRV